jgi:hypothetical protein
LRGNGDAPDLQCPCAQHARPLVLGHVRGGCALRVLHSLVLLALDCVLDLVLGSSRGIRVANRNDVVVLVVAVCVVVVAGLITIVFEDIGLLLLVEIDGLAAVVSTRLLNALFCRIVRLGCAQQKNRMETCTYSYSGSLPPP